MAQRSKLQSQQAVPKTLTLIVIMTILVVLMYCFRENCRDRFTDFFRNDGTGRHVRGI